MDTKNLLRVAACAAVLSLACAGRLPAAPTTMSKPMPAAKPTAARKAQAPAPVRIDNAWVRAAPPGTDMLAGYMDIHNEGKSPVRLVSARSDTFGMVELHRSQIVDGVSSMRPAGEQVIPVGGSLQIQPGGLHWMLMQSVRALKPGDTVHFTLHFADGSEANVKATVRMGMP